MNGLIKGIWFFVKFSLRLEKRYLLYQSLSCLLDAGLPLLLVYVPKCILEELMGSVDPMRLVLLICILLVGGCLIRVLSTLFASKAFEARLRLTSGFMQELHGHMADADYENLENKSYPDERRRAEKLLYANQHGFGYVLVSAMDIFSKAITLVGFLAILLRLHAPLLLVFLLLVALDAWFAARNKREATKLQMEAVKVEGHITYMDRLFTEPRYGKEMRVYGLKQYFLEKNAQEQRESLWFYLKSNRYWNRSALLGACTELVRQGGAYAYLLARVLAGEVSIADFTLYTGAVAGFAQSLRAVLEDFIDIKQYGMYYDAMESFLHIPAKLREGGKEALPKEEAPSFCFENVSFRYKGQKEYALKNVSFEIKPGEKLAVVGENGAGKTTLIKLMMRIYKPTQGRILFCGRDIQTIDYDEYMRLFSAVFQDFQLYAFTLLENLALCGKGDRRRAEAVLEQVGLGDYVRKLPQGLDTYMTALWDEKGVEPSGGQVQRLALARALYRDAPVVVLDEPTAALDPRAEYEIYRSFAKLTDGKTAVYISHRLSSARFCDRILVLEGGRVAEWGNHEQLMQAQGLYAELFQMQSQFYV